MDDNGQLYLELIKKCLTGILFKDDRLITYKLPGFLNILTKFFTQHKIHIGSIIKFDPDIRREARDWPHKAHTMIGLQRLDNIQFLIAEILKNNIQGDLIETGVWRGGATIFMCAVLKAYGITNRTVWVADSFEGLPEVNKNKYPIDAQSKSGFHNMPILAVPLEEVKENFKTYGLLDDQVRFVKGFFKDSLPKAKIKKLSLLRLDGDMYESTMDSFANLYPKLSKGGYIIIDDYNALAECKQAVEDYREKHNINDGIISIDWSAVYWKKS